MRAMAWFRRQRVTADVAALPKNTGDVAQIADLPVSVALAFGINASATRVTRKEAMALPVVRQGRTLIAGTIGTFPLVCRRGRAVVVDRPLLTVLDPRTTRAWTITWTVDDLMFYGVAWWRVLTWDSFGYPTTAERVDHRRLFLDYASRQAYVDGQLVDPRHLIRFDGPDEGILTTGSRALRTAIRLEDAVNRYALMDVPAGVLKDTRPGMTLTDEEITTLLTRWRTARAEYGTGYLNGSLDYVPVQFNAQQLQLVEARQHMASELARLMLLDAPAVNAPQASGMTYDNTVAARRGRLDTSFRFYLEALAGRLSMPDVTPRGQTVTFDTSGYLRGDAGEAITAAVQAAGGPVMTRDEARDRLLDMPPQEDTP